MCPYNPINHGGHRQYIATAIGCRWTSPRGRLPHRCQGATPIDRAEAPNAIASSIFMIFLAGPAYPARVNRLRSDRFRYQSRYRFGLCRCDFTCVHPEYSRLRTCLELRSRVSRNSVGLGHQTVIDAIDRQLKKSTTYPLAIFFLENVYETWSDWTAWRRKNHCI